MNRFDNSYKNGDLVEKRVFTKIHDWHYEHEYRIMLSKSDSHEGKILKYNKNSLKHVIFGLKVGSQDKIRVYNIINENYLSKNFKVAFSKAEVKNRKYELEIKEIPDIEKYIDSL